MIETLIFSLLSIIVGLCFCFAGWSYFRLLFPIWGFVIGLMGGVQFMIALTGSAGFLVTAMGLVIGLIIGTVFALLSTFVYKLAVILFGASVGYALGAGIWTLLGLNTPFLAVITGLLGGFFMIGLFVSAQMPKRIMIILTGLAGSMAVITGILALFGQVPPSDLGLSLINPYVQNSFFWFIIWAVLGGLGIFAQHQAAREEELVKVLIWDDISKELAAGK